MRKHLSTIVLLFILLIGLSLLLYPTVSDYWNSFHQTKAITTYAENVAALDNASYDAIWDAARAYNRNLLNRSNSFLLSQEQKAEYESLLDISGQGIMGYTEIPEIDVSLPIYHGTEDTVLQVAVGHLEWTSLPVAGRAPIASSPVTGVCPAPSCSPTWTSSGRGTSFSCGCWMRS